MTQDQHQDAFEYYHSLGAKRTYKSVAAHLGVSVSTIKAWARAGHWRQRVAERHATVARQAADQVIGSAVADSSRKRKMVELALLKVIKAINADRVKVQVADLDRLLRLQAYLDGNRSPLNLESLRSRPITEVTHLIMDWFATLNDEERSAVIATLRQRERDADASRRRISPGDHPHAAP